MVRIFIDKVRHTSAVIVMHRPTHYETY
jgi:hypothetical protein